MRYASRITGETTVRNKGQRIMYYLSNILPICRIVFDYFDLSNELYYSELDLTGGGKFLFAKAECAYSAYIAHIIPSMLV